jgi:hypothetical protein
MSPKNPDTAAKDFDRLLHFMADDLANTTTSSSSAASSSDSNGSRKQYFRPSTRDRIGPNGERIVKQDFEVENLISYTEEFSKPEEDIILHTEEAITMPSPTAPAVATLGSDNADPSTTTAADNSTTVNIEDYIIQELDKSLEAVHAARIKQETVSKLSSPSSSFNSDFYIPPSIASDIPTPTTLNLEREYLILSPTLKIIKSLKKPLHNERSPKDLYTILSQLQSPEKYLRTITKFESQGWSIIGGNDKMLVFERRYSKKDRDAKYLYKLVFGSIASVGLLLGGFLTVSNMT